MVSALAACFLRSSSSTSIRVDRPAVVVVICGVGCRSLAQAQKAPAIFSTSSLTKTEAVLKSKAAAGGQRGERGVESMIKQANIAIERMSERERRLREMKYARRNKMRYIDR